MLNRSISVKKNFWLKLPNNSSLDIKNPAIMRDFLYLFQDETDLAEFHPTVTVWSEILTLQA